jgi:hypothetical protein
MKFSIKLLFILLCCSLLIISCKKDKLYQPVQLCAELSNNADSVHKYLKGEWNWVEDRYMNPWTGEMHYQYPKIAGYRQIAKISLDTITISRFNEPPFAGTYVIGKESDITNMPEDKACVLIMFPFSSPGNRLYYRILICKEYMVFDMSYRGDIAPEIIYQRKR